MSQLQERVEPRTRGDESAHGDFFLPIPSDEPSVEEASQAHLTRDDVDRLSRQLQRAAPSHQSVSAEALLAKWSPLVADLEEV